MDVSFDKNSLNMQNIYDCFFLNLLAALTKLNIRGKFQKLIFCNFSKYRVVFVQFEGCGPIGAMKFRMKTKHVYW